MAVFGLILVLVLLAWGTGAQNLKYLWDTPSVIMVGVTTLGLVLFAGGRIPVMFKAVFARSASPEELRAGIEGWKKARIYSLAAAIFGGLIGLIIMLNNLNDPSQLGPGMAVALISFVYAMMVGFVFCLPLQVRLEAKLGASTDTTPFGSAVLAYIVGWMLGLTTFFVLLASFGSALSGR